MSEVVKVRSSCVAGVARRIYGHAVVTRFTLEVQAGPIQSALVDDHTMTGFSPLFCLVAR